MKNNDTEIDKLSEEDVVNELMFGFEGYADINDMNARIQGTFDGRGYLTRNKGFCVRIGHQTFDITVKER